MTETLATATGAKPSFSQSAQQRSFFDTFGYLHLPGALVDETVWIRAEFESVFSASGIEHDGSARSFIGRFVDASERLCTLVDHPVVQGVLEGLLGADANYLGSDGNYYTGDTGWHPDGDHRVGTYLKIAMYLEPLDGGNGALRVIPGSHRVDSLDWEARQAGQSEVVWGMSGNVVPAVALESRPGDLVIFNHNIMHSSWGGSGKRPMFTMNWGAQATTDAETAELQMYMRDHMGGFSERAYGTTMLATAGPERMRHLKQVLANEHVMAG